MYCKLNKLNIRIYNKILNYILHMLTHKHTHTCHKDKVKTCFSSCLLILMGAKCGYKLRRVTSSGLCLSAIWLGSYLFFHLSTLAKDRYDWRCKTWYPYKFFIIIHVLSSLTDSRSLASGNYISVDVFSYTTLSGGRFPGNDTLEERWAVTI